MERKIYYESTDNIKLCGLLNVVNTDKKIVILCHGLTSNKESNGFNLLVRKLEEEKRKKDKKNSKTSSTNPELEAKAGCLGFFGMAGFIAGATMGGGVGAFIGIILGSLFALWFYDYRFNN